METKDAILNFEINNSGQVDRIRNYLYSNSIFLNNVILDKTYKANKIVIQFNLTLKSDTDDVILDYHCLYSPETGKSLVPEMRTLELVIENAKKICYDNLTEDMIELCKLLTIQHLNEQEYLEFFERESDEEMKAFGTEVIRFNKAKDLWISPEQDEEFTKNAIRDYAFEDGKHEGKDERNTEIAKNMLNKGCDVKFIKEITGLSKKEIEKLKE